MDVSRPARTAYVELMAMEHRFAQLYMARLSEERHTFFKAAMPGSRSTGDRPLFPDTEAGRYRHAIDSPWVFYRALGGMGPAVDPVGMVVRLLLHFGAGEHSEFDFMSVWKKPPPPGSLQFEIDIAPASLQSAPHLRHTVKSLVASMVRAAEYLLSGEVEVGVTWLLHEKERYYGVHSPDIDNILKPLLDGLSGPDGLLINDCQVQSVRCHWIDWTSENHRLQFDVRYMADDWIPKEALVWVEIRDKLCLPLHTNTPAEWQLRSLELWERMFESRRKIMELTGDYGLGKCAMPVQMPFHRARLRGYHVIAIEEMKRQLSNLPPQDKL